MEKNLNTASLEEILKAMQDEMEAITTAINNIIERDRYYEDLWATYSEADADFHPVDEDNF